MDNFQGQTFLESQGISNFACVQQNYFVTKTFS